MSNSNPRFTVLENNALGVRDTLDGNNIHLGSKIEAVAVATMLNLFHDKAIECKQATSMQAQRILELTGDIQTAREVYLRQEQRVVDAEAKALLAIAKNLREDNDTDNYEVGVHF